MCMILYQGQSYSSSQTAILRLFFNRIRSLVSFFLASDWDFFLEIGKKGG